MPKKHTGQHKNSTSGEQKHLVFKEDIEEYAKVTSLLGDNRIMLVLPDETQVMGIIPGRFRKRVWITVDDILLVDRREFQSDKVDILHKYSHEDVNKLNKIGELPEFFFTKGLTANTRHANSNFEFEVVEDHNVDDI